MKIDLRLGDCLELMPKIEAASIDAVIADIPYGTTACKWDTVIPFEPMWKELKRICRGAIVLTASQPFTSALVMSNPSAFKHEWIWIKNRGSNFANTVREPMKEHESVLVFSYSKWTYNKQMQQRTGGGKGRIKYRLNSGQGSENYRQFTRGQTPFQGELRVPASWQKFNTEVGLHSTQKPVPLMEYLVRTYTNEGDTVLDFTMGSGTTMVACINARRNGIGIEKNEKYFEVAEKRVMDAQKYLADAQLQSSFI